MSDDRNDHDDVELDGAPAFEIGERVVSRYAIRNDGTYPGRDVGDPLVERGDLGWVSSIGTFLQQYYVYAVDFAERGVLVGMKARELVSIDRLPPHVLEQLGERAAQLAELGARALGPRAGDDERPA